MNEPHPVAPLRVFSFGGGVQSTAVLALQALGRLEQPYDVFFFADVGEDSENPDTLAYIENHTVPFCEEFGIRFETGFKTRYGERDTVRQSAMRDNRSVPIPARKSNGSPGNRTCTVDFKIKVVDRWIKAQQADYAVIGLGISIDELHRARDEDWHAYYDRKQTKPIGFHKRREHPLIDLWLRRDDCKRAIDSVGLPVPPKSSCYFCPFMKRYEWIELKRNHPALFERAVEMERQVNDKRGAIGKDRVYLHPSCTPLDQAVGDQLRLPFMREFDAMEAEACGGYCHT